MSADDDIEQQTDGTPADIETAADIETDSDAGPDADSGARGRRGLSIGTLPVIAVVAFVSVLAMLAAGGLTGWLYLYQYRPDEQTDAAVAQSVVDAARDGIVALLSYKPDTLDQDVAAAKSHLTGDFLHDYDQLTKQVVSPAAKQRAVTTTAQVVGAAASELHPDSAVVLIFVNQVTTSKDRPDPAMTSSSVKVSLTKVHGAWLITKFDPV